MCFFNCFKLQAPFQSIFERKSVPLNMDQILQRIYKPKQNPRRHVYNGLCCCFCIYLFSEGHVSTSEMLPFYTITIF